MVVGSIISNATTGFGLMAATIGVCGFLAHARPAIAGKDEAELRRATAIGGLTGCLVALFVVVLSWAVG
jgi:hypothetical protein